MSKKFAVDVRGDDYDFVEECWGGAMELLYSKEFDSYEEANAFRKGVTPMVAAKYESDNGYNGISVEIHELVDGLWEMAACDDWIGMCKVPESRVKYEYGLIDGPFASHDTCDKADTLYEAMECCSKLEFEYSGTVLGKWKYDKRHEEWVALPEDDEEFPWYIREIRE